jgi:Rieske Fe-S protein
MAASYPEPGASAPLRLGRATRSLQKGSTMAECEVCGNDYDKAFEVIAAGERHVFDSFECAIHRMAPVCEHCGCKVVGHGAEVDGRFFCCAHCARDATGVTENEVADRA